MSFKIVQQIILIAVSLGLVFFYIQPKLGEIDTLEAEVERYQAAVNNATKYNAELSRLINQINALSQADVQALERFLPLQPDPVATARDIETIATRSNVIVNEITVLERETSDGQVQNAQNIDFDMEMMDEEGMQRNVVDPSADLESTDVEVSVSASYDDFKSFLTALEANTYPLFVTELTLEESTSATDALLNYTITIRTFSQTNSF